MYPLLRQLLFLLPPESAHVFSMLAWNMLHPLFPNRMFEPTPQPVSIGKLQFKNPLGLAAGFDKNAAYLAPLFKLGFGSIEIGTVTPKPQLGNPKPRLLRLPSNQALINRMGFNNQGVLHVQKNIEKFRNKHANNNSMIGGNIGKNKDTPLQDAVNDYLICLKTLASLVDYLVINVSSPNTPGLRELQKPEYLENIFYKLQEANIYQKPLFVKIAPDLSLHELTNIAHSALKYNLTGIIASNTSLNRVHLTSINQQKADQFGFGGLSGSTLLSNNLTIIRHLKSVAPNLPIIASGGIQNSLDLQHYREAGAKIFQIWTGFIYQGPFILKKISNFVPK